MQYSVPQFVDVEDMILPHLTIKQFLVLVGCGILGLIYWGIFGVGPIFFVLLILTLMIFVPIAFIKFNGRPIMANLPGLVRYFSTPKQRVFIRAAGLVLHQKSTQSQIGQTEAMPEALPESRLKKLAYLLDEKAAEEDRLLRTGEYSKKWLNEV